MQKTKEYLGFTLWASKHTHTYTINTETVSTRFFSNLVTTLVCNEKPVSKNQTNLLLSSNLKTLSSVSSCFFLPLFFLLQNSVVIVTAEKQIVCSVVTLSRGSQGQTNRAVYQSRKHRWLLLCVGFIFAEERMVRVGTLLSL